MVVFHEKLTFRGGSDDDACATRGVMTRTQFEFATTSNDSGSDRGAEDLIT
jgi:hypothetical protein